jgi:hypothetical protein
MLEPVSKPLTLVGLGMSVGTPTQGITADVAAVSSFDQLFQAIAVIKKLGLRPRRTLRVCFYVNEENGGAGGRAYRKMVGERRSPIRWRRSRWMAARKNQSDSASVAVPKKERPKEKRPGGVPTRSRDRQAARRHRGWQDQSRRRRLRHRSVDGGRRAGVRRAHAGIHYFDWHHTDADSFDKIVPREFQLNVASLAVLCYVLAEWPERIGDLR